MYKITYFIQHFIQQYMNYINKYKLNQCIGKGSFGEIYRATNTITNEKVAIKIIKHGIGNPM